ncbi:MAG: hypothetical protein FWB79_00345 [Treponema sp.]|nr:hypothetical protein [Treponema sp.]
MAKKKAYLGMLVMVLAFGMTVVGCDNDPTNGNGVGSGGGSVDNSQFIGGLWRVTAGGNAAATLNFTADDRVTLSIHPDLQATMGILRTGTGSYSANGRNATLTIGGQTTTAELNAAGTNLVLRYGAESFVFFR